MAIPVALEIIRREHAALSAVLHSLVLMVHDARRRGRPPDFHALRVMLFYVAEFPERLHHVKEAKMLFPRLRECTRDADRVLARLEREHADGADRVRELEHLLTAWELLGDARRVAFEKALHDYARFYFAHMRIEETEVLPLAERHFGEDDWRILGRAFGAHRDPLAGTEPEAPYAALFRTIVGVMPPAATIRPADADAEAGHGGDAVLQATARDTAARRGGPTPEAAPARR